MGMPIIGHLARRGFTVLVHDADPEKRTAVLERGARFALTPGEVARDCAIVLICVGYERQLRDLLLGEGDLLAALPRDAVVAVLSTVSPEVMAGLAEAAAKHGVNVVDAPVCRGSWAADAGELLTLLGGDERATRRFAEVARAYSTDVVHIGDVGAGQVAKAVNNLILWACLVADHEGLALARRYAVDIDRLRGALAMSSAANHALENWNNQTMAWAEDDLKIVQEMAAVTGVGLPQAGLNREICRVLKPRRYDLDRYGA
jgi:3-hydroxyisobutyrate dehydrogenase-like beta-hydroxyacid dehydrogenase